jgi:hypothetical protein
MQQQRMHLFRPWEEKESRLLNIHPSSHHQQKAGRARVRLALLWCGDVTTTQAALAATLSIWGYSHSFLS